MKQLALLIGNNAYPEGALENAVNDANALTEKLRELGFECLTTTDGTRKAMDRALAEFGDRLEDYEVGVFFFAGHGMQIGGENYLAAIDTDFESERDAKFSSLPLNKVIETMEAGSNRTNILILDACRTNPYERRWRASGGLRGLAPVYAPKGMIVAYATSPGQVASDGIGANGAYTHALLTHIGQQDLSVESLFKRVRNTLSSSTHGKQISWEHTSLMGDYFFNHSSATGGGVTAYSEAALADRDFGPLRGPAGAIIGELKSHDWYKQNPAIDKIDKRRLENATKNECFVIGRNIYQAACGGANAASAFLSDLRRELAKLPDSIAFHLLNGMLFEVYFDSRGLKRERAKADKIDAVFTVEEEEAHANSFGFIRQKLNPYLDELFYVPGSHTEVCVDAAMARFNKRPTVQEICFEGENILYSASGEGYFELNDDVSLTKKTRESFRTELSEALVTPTFRLRITYVGRVPAADEEFLGPWRPNLQRIAPK